jgi:hypothetical protein
MIPYRYCFVGRADNVSEEDHRQDAIRLRPVTFTGEEFLDLGEDSVGIGAPGQMDWREPRPRTRR